MEADAEADAERGPLRTCVLTREEGMRDRMVRLVAAPDGRIVPDLAANLPGRGIWLSARADVLLNLRLHAALARAARRQVSVPSTLAEEIRAGLQQRFMDRIGLARRAGQAVAGFEKVKAWLASGRAGLIVTASDGSADEMARLIGRQVSLPVLRIVPASVLGAAFGRERTVHVAVAAGGIARSLESEAFRLAGMLDYRGAGGEGRDSAQAHRGKDLDGV